ncbi:hypothetical protein [Brevibacillus sp. 179-C 1.1 NHS]|uniref:hypothetical protein n=1 Tax=Brevibacillus sp. 179-C 1.1 NHS TaxID=3235177 RepID=UPI0039A382E3
MKKVLFSLLSLSLVFGISSTALAKDAKQDESKLSTLAVFYDREPNNTPAGANFFELGNQINGAFQYEPIDSEDYFYFIAPETGYYNFSLSFNTENHYGLFLLNNNQVEIGKTTSRNPSFTARVVKGQKYYLWVDAGSIAHHADPSYSVYTSKSN